MHDPIDSGLKALSSLTSSPATDISYDAVWQRAGELQARKDGRQRMALFAGLFVVGLGAGAGLPQTAAIASESPSVAFSGGDLTPSALLHVTR